MNIFRFHSVFFLNFFKDCDVLLDTGAVIFLACPLSLVIGSSELPGFCCWKECYTELYCTSVLSYVPCFLSLGQFEEKMLMLSPLVQPACTPWFGQTWSPCSWSVPGSLPPGPGDLLPLLVSPMSSVTFKPQLCQQLSPDAHDSFFLSSADGSNTEPPTPFSFHCYCHSQLSLESMAGWQSSLTRASQKMVVREGSPLAVTQDTCAHALTTLCRHSPQLRGPSHAPAERRVQIEDRGAGSYLWLEEERWAHAVPLQEVSGLLL